jgi:hypothetical protein
VLYDMLAPELLRHGRALLLHDAADEEAGAMGLARLAWMAARQLWPRYAPFGSARWRRAGASVELEHWGNQRVAEWPCRLDVSDAHAIALVCVHLGLLDRVEVTDGG